MKKLFTLLCIVALLFGCSTKESDEKVAEKVEYKNAYADLTDINEIKSEAEIVGIDLSNTSAIYDAAKYIVIATIQSIDGGSNEDLVDGGYVYPYTYGTLSIDKSYKGDLQEGTMVNYTRMGGIIPYSKWYDSLYKSEQEKHDYLAKGINPKYVKKC